MCGYYTLHKKFPLYQEHGFWVMKAFVPIVTWMARVLLDNDLVNSWFLSYATAVAIT
jgi:hypothetical protein